MAADKIIFEELTRLRGRIQANMSRTRTNASGKTSRSLKVKREGDTFLLVGREYFATVERGRRPGPVPSGFVGIIRQWIIDKGLRVDPIPYIREESSNWSPKYTPLERGIQSMAGAIAHTIKTKGSELFRVGGYDDIYTQEIEVMRGNLSTKLAQGFEIQIQSINDILKQLENDNI